MNYIINPWLFYLADVSNTLRTICLVMGIIGFLVFIALSIFFSFNNSDYLIESEEDCKERLKKRGMFITWAIISFVIIIIGALVPSKTTVYQMIIASGLTYDNVAKVAGGVKEVVDYIVNSALTIAGK